LKEAERGETFFWIIVDGDTPTSFRSADREELLPTLTQLQRKQPQVKLMV
jgi:hypothetical protein